MKVIIPKNIHEEIDFYVQRSPVEVSGLGRVKKHDNGDMEVVKVYLLDQVNTGTSTELEDKAVTKLMYESRKDEGDLTFWWHSHVDMGVFWSGTDMATIREFGSNGYLVATVFNKKGEMRSAYYQGGTDFLPRMFADNLETVIGGTATDKQRAEWEKLYKAKCKQPKPTYHNPWANHNEWQGGLYGQEVVEYAPKKTKPKRKRGRPRKNKKPTVLGSDVSSTELVTTLDKASAHEWRIHLSELWSVHESDIQDADLQRFYDTWDGDFNAMHVHVISQMMKEV